MTEGSGQIYVLIAQELNRIKIGATKGGMAGAIKRRRHAELGPCILDLHSVTEHTNVKAEDDALYRRFKASHHHQDWFEITPEVRAWLKTREVVPVRTDWKRAIVGSRAVYPTEQGRLCLDLAAD
jgi:hypothetical protein